MIFITWILLSFLVAFFGSSRKIGFGVALLVSLLLSPLIGFICLILSKDKQTDAVEKAILQGNLEQRILQSKPTQKDYDTLEKAYKTKLITQQEYEYRKTLLVKADTK